MAVYHAVRSFERGDSISNTLEMEALLYAAGSRQCNVGASFGIHNGENYLWICCIPSPEGVWQALEREFSFLQDNSWDQINGEKRDLLMKLFRIPQTELASLESPCRIRDLVLERVALLEVLR
jgi:KEOPS complex subunit Cgi121